MGRKKKIPKASFSHQILTMGSKVTQHAENYTCCQTLVWHSSPATP